MRETLRRALFSSCQRLSHPEQVASSSAVRLNSTSAIPSTSQLPKLKPLLQPITRADRLSSLPQTTSQAVSLLQTNSTPSHGRYITARLHARNYLLHPKDVLTVPQLKSLPPPGSLLALNQILEVGSREYIIKAPEAVKDKIFPGPGGDAIQGERPVLPSDVVRCSVTVLEHTKSPMERKLHKKRRKGYEKVVSHKQGWTRMRVGDILLGEEGL